MAERGAALAYCPSSNMFLGDGITRITEMQALGIRDRARHRRRLHQQPPLGLRGDAHGRAAPEGAPPRRHARSPPRRRSRWAPPGARGSSASTPAPRGGRPPTSSPSISTHPSLHPPNASAEQRRLCDVPAGGQRRLGAGAPGRPRSAPRHARPDVAARAREPAHARLGAGVSPPATVPGAAGMTGRRRSGGARRRAPARRGRALMRILEVVGLTKRYAGVVALDGVSFTAEEGRDRRRLRTERRGQDHVPALRVRLRGARRRAHHLRRPRDHRTVDAPDHAARHRAHVSGRAALSSDLTVAENVLVALGHERARRSPLQRTGGARAGTPRTSSSTGSGSPPRRRRQGGRAVARQAEAP